MMELQPYRVFADYPTHTYYSHGTGSPRENVIAAIDTGLEAIDIPAGVTFIADNAFDGCGTVYVYTNDNPYVIEYVRNHDNLIGLK